MTTAQLLRSQRQNGMSPAVTRLVVRSSLNRQERDLHAHHPNALRGCCGKPEGSP